MLEQPMETEKLIPKYFEQMAFLAKHFAGVFILFYFIKR